MKRMNNKAEQLRREEASLEIQWKGKKRSKDKGERKDNVKRQLCQKK